MLRHVNQIYKVTFLRRNFLKLLQDFYKQKDLLQTFFSYGIYFL